MKIGVVVVTYNRLSDLKKALQAYDKQTKLPEYIIVVNNCSTDGTSSYLNNWKSKQSAYPKYAITMDKNTGGAGGFYTGLDFAMNLDAEWIWVADDDAFPFEDSFEKLSDGYQRFIAPLGEKTSAVCAAVINKGEFHLQHRNYLSVGMLKVKIKKSDLEDYKKEFFEFDVLSYVGAAISKEALKQVGLTNKNYFIYCDDQEHSFRLKQYGKMYCITSSRVQHDTPGFNNKELFWGHYYFYRNGLLMLREHYPVQFVFRWIKRYLKSVVSYRNITQEKRELLQTAYWDALKGKDGVHNIYKPGWKPTKIK